MAHTISATRLKPNTIVIVQGEIQYACLTRYVEGKALENLKQYRQFIPQSPFTTVTLNNAKIIPQNPNQLSLEEQYVQESFYASTKNPGMTCYRIDNKSPNFPRFFQVAVNPDGTINPKDVFEVPPTNEPAAGLKVNLVLRVFKPKNFPNCGIALDSIIAQEKFRYYEGGDAINRLAQMGITVHEMSEEERAQSRKEAEAHAAAQQAAEAAAPEAPTPVAPPVGDPYSSAAQNNGGMIPQTPAQTAPAQPAAPAANAEPETWSCPKCGATNTGKFCNECGSPKPTGTVPMNAPIGGNNAYANPDVLGEARTGIAFDPNDQNRNY